MAYAADYKIKYFDQFGIFLYEFEKFIELDIERTKNEIGTLNIVLPGSFYSISDFKKDYRCEVWRNGSLVGNTCWFLQRVEKTLKNSCDVEFTLTFADSMDLLNRRVNANYSSDGFISVGTVTAPADDAMKIIFDFNYNNTTTDSGGPPDYPVIINTNSGPPLAVVQAYSDIGSDLTGRQLDILYEGFKSEGAVLTTNSSFIKVYDALKEIADSAIVIENASSKIEFYNNIWFDIVYTPKTDVDDETFTFKTWVGIRGNDLRNNKFVGPDHNNLIDAVYINDWANRADIAYVAGSGYHDAQAVGQATLPVQSNSYFYSLPFGPVEIVTSYDTTATATGDELDAEGFKALGKNISTKQITGTILNIDEFDFITDYNYGDVLSLAWDDVVESIEITSFNINVSGKEETIDIPLSVITEKL